MIHIKLIFFFSVTFFSSFVSHSYPEKTGGAEEEERGQEKQWNKLFPIQPIETETKMFALKTFVKNMKILSDASMLGKYMFVLF